ncbi:hypothetical protein [Pseudoscardovia suis]
MASETKEANDTGLLGGVSGIVQGGGDAERIPITPNQKMGVVPSGIGETTGDANIAIASAIAMVMILAAGAGDYVYATSNV